MKNKKAQFFLFFSVIIAILILGMSSMFNYISKPEFNSQRFYKSCESYEYEINRISEMYSKGKIDDENESIYYFTFAYIENERKNGNNISLIYNYTNTFDGKIMNFISGDFYGEEIKEIINNINLGDHDFYYIIQLKKGEELFNCQSS